MIRSQVSALSVFVLIGSRSLTAFLAIAHDMADDQYLQFFARVLGSARDGQTCLLNCAVRSARELGRYGPPRWQIASSQLPSARSDAVDSEMSARSGPWPLSPVDPCKDVRASQAFQIPPRHNWKRALALLNDAPEPCPNMHHHHRPERCVRVLDLSCQFQPRVALAHQCPQMIVARAMRCTSDRPAPGAPRLCFPA